VRSILSSASVLIALTLSFAVNSFLLLLMNGYSWQATSAGLLTTTNYRRARQEKILTSQAWKEPDTEG
jgi:hypothetical protein